MGEKSFLKSVIINRNSDAYIWYINASWACEVTFKAVETVLGLGGGGKKKFASPRKFFYITLIYKRDTVFFIRISVISKFTEPSVYFILIYIHLFISHYFQTLNFLGWQNIGGEQLPPPPLPPCSYGHDFNHNTEEASWLLLCVRISVTSQVQLATIIQVGNHN